VSRILGVDLGEKRLGVALSDPSGTVASPFATIPHRSQRGDVERITALCREHEVAAVVVGWPRNMDGTSGLPARRAEAFAQVLRRALAVPVELWDERLSTVAADRALLEGNVTRRRRRVLRDRVAAALILQAWLDARMRGLPAPPSGHKTP
jgi:putative holliday junction resolvase